MGFKFDKADVQEMKRLEIEVRFRSVATKTDSGTSHLSVCDVLDRWNKKHLLSSDPLGSREDAFKNALEKAKKLKRTVTGKSDDADEVEKYKALVAQLGDRIAQLEKSGSKKVITGAT